MDNETSEFETMVVDAIRSEWVRAGPVAVASVVALARELHPAPSARIRASVVDAKKLMDAIEVLEFTAALEGLRVEARGLTGTDTATAFVERMKTMTTKGGEQ